MPDNKAKKPSPKKVTVVVPKDSEELVSGSEIERNWRGVLIALLVILAVLSMILVSTVLLSPPEPGPRINKAKLQLPNITSPNTWNFVNNATWISDEELVYRDSVGGVSKLNATDLTSRQILGNSSFRQLDAMDFRISNDLKFVLLLSEIKKVYTNTKQALYHTYEISTQVLRVVRRKGEEPEVKEPLQEALWGPKGSTLVFVQRADLYYCPDAARMPECVIRLTDTGSNLVSNGVPDLIYQEEIMLGGGAVWFSPTGSHLAYASFNDTLVGQVAYTLYSEKKPYPSLHTLSYPKPGTMNPNVSVYVASLSEPKLNSAIMVEPPALIASEPLQGYLTLVKWMSEETLMTVWTNRRQNVSVYSLCTAPNFTCTESYIHKVSDGSVNLRPSVLGAPGTESFITSLPVLDGPKGHYYQVCLVNNSVMIPLTLGQISVIKLLAWDSDNQIVYFEAAPEGRPTQRHTYRVSAFNISSTHCLTCLSPHYNLTNNSTNKEDENGVEDRDWPVMSPNCLYTQATCSPPACRYYILECLGPDVPSVHIMEPRTGTRVCTLDPNERLKNLYNSFAMPQVKLFQVEVEGGFHAQVKLQLPPGFREHEDMVFPMIVKVSGKPGSVSVTYRWSVDYSSYLASQKNYIVVELDVRGSARQGLRHMNQLHLKIGTTDTQDIIALAEYLKDTLKFVDKGRIGVYGHGYGGYLASMVLAQDSKLFHCGASLSGIYSWPHYNSVWTERWLATANVTDNYRGYQESDLGRLVGNLKEKMYLSVHGSADHLVHYQHAMIIAKALLQENVLYSHLTYPDEGHSLEGVSQHLYMTMDQFWKDCFGDLDFTEWESREMLTFTIRG